MCGIVGYVGARAAQPILFEGLKRLEYRGYDSAGIACCDGRALRVIKSGGRLERLMHRLTAQPLRGGIGIAHTRWATHGAPDQANAHPHTDCRDTLAVVHNGIIENHAALRARLCEAGHTFRSETDSEVIAHLIEDERRRHADLAAAVRSALAQLKGSYAVVVLAQDEPQMLVAARRESPLLIGVGADESIIASDIPAILPHTQAICPLEDGELAIVRASGFKILDAAGRAVARSPEQVVWRPEAAVRDGFDDFMRKEIAEQPAALRRALHGRLSEDGSVDLEVDAASLARARKIWFVGCGTAYHAGLIGRALCERWAGMEAEAELASEFRYRDVPLGAGHLVVVISQSGETADTLAALREAKRRGADTLAVVNVFHSSIAREADRVLYTHAGPEIAVASTKAYVTQVACLTLLALALGRERGSGPQADIAAACARVPELAAQVEAGVEGEIRAIVEEWHSQRDAFFIGRGLDFAVALEGQLKLKEISYVHAEALVAGELKHGTLALIAPGVPVVALATQPQVAAKMHNNAEEVAARGGDVLWITTPRAAAVSGLSNGRPRAAGGRRIFLPDVTPEIAPVLAVIPLQLLAYHWAKRCGRDVDKPRNLAKSVTVE